MHRPTDLTACIHPYHQNKERVWQQHRIANLIEQIRRRAEDLEAIYEDKDGCVLHCMHA